MQRLEFLEKICKHLGKEKKEYTEIYTRKIPAQLLRQSSKKFLQEKFPLIPSRISSGPPFKVT
jgi:hypothetical protein